VLTITNLVAVSAADSPYPSDRTDVLDGLYGTSSFVVGFGLVAAGIAVARDGRWVGWQRYAPLLVGVYVFVPMTPMIMASYSLARLGIGGWTLAFAVLG
jgi:fructose-1,6-bisphosphatase/inositol monophosphatase family enzyme